MTPSPSCTHVAAPAPRRGERGFTLIELLVVILIIGILAAIAIPSFLNQRAKGQDASAKSDARNLLTQVEACYTDSHDYNACTTAAQVEAGDNEIPWGMSAGQAEVLPITSGSPQGWATIATSSSGTVFGFFRNKSDGSLTNVCFVPSGRYPSGGCRAGGSLAGFGVW